MQRDPGGTTDPESAMRLLTRRDALRRGLLLSLVVPMAVAVSGCAGGGEDDEEGDDD